MGKIVIVYEERCGDCRNFMGESSYETEDFFSDSSLGGTTVKRKTKLKRCEKCQPVFDQKIKELRDKGKVQIVPFGKSGRKKEDQQSTLKDFVGRDKGREKKEAGHDNRLLRMP